MDERAGASAPGDGGVREARPRAGVEPRLRERARRAQRGQAAPGDDHAGRPQKSRRRLRGDPGRGWAHPGQRRPAGRRRGAAWRDGARPPAVAQRRARRPAIHRVRGSDRFRASADGRRGADRDAGRAPSARGRASTVIGGVRLGLSLAGVEEQVRGSLKLWGGVTLAFLVVGTFVIYGFSRRITNPVKQLTEQAQKIAAGHLEEQIPVKSRDEIGQLATAFNSMTGALAGDHERQGGRPRRAAGAEPDPGGSHPPADSRAPGAKRGAGALARGSPRHGGGEPGDRRLARPRRGPGYHRDARSPALERGCLRHLRAGCDARATGRRRRTRPGATTC